MTQPTVEQKIREIIAAQLRIEPHTITADTTLQTLGADSLDVVELIMRFEDEFHIEISDTDAEKLHTYHEMVAYITEQLHKR